MNKAVIALVLAGSLGLAACSQKTADSAENTADAAAADVNAAETGAVTDVNAADTAATGNAVEAPAGNTADNAAK